MIVSTITGQTVNVKTLENYFKRLIDRFFKILPIKECNEQSLTEYMQSLQLELLGAKKLIEVLNNDPALLSLIATLQYLIDNPSCTNREVKREVFKAISICTKLKSKYTDITEGGVIK